MNQLANVKHYFIVFHRFAFWGWLQRVQKMRSIFFSLFLFLWGCFLHCKSMSYSTPALSTDINSNELMHPIIPCICAFLIDANTSHQPLIKQCRMYVKMLMDFSSSSTRKFLIFPSFIPSRLHWTIDSKTSLKELLFVFGIHGTLLCTGVHPFTIAQ